MSEAVRDLHTWFLRKAVQAQQMAASAALTALTGLEEEKPDAADRALICKTKAEVWALAANKLRGAAELHDTPEASDVLQPEPIEDPEE